MAKKKVDSSVLGELLSAKLYKKNQGRMTRQLSAVAFLLVLFFGTWTLSQGPLSDSPHEAVRLGIPLLIAGLGAWIVFRAIHYPRFADFLISVEAEMDKVSWSTWPELWRSTMVVVSAMFFLGFVLLFFDFFWQFFFDLIGFLRIGKGQE